MLLLVLVSQVGTKLIDKNKDNKSSQLESTVKHHVRFVASKQPYNEVQPKVPHPGVLTYHNSKQNNTYSHGKHNKTSKYEKPVVTTLRPTKSRTVVTTIRPKNKTSNTHGRPTHPIPTTTTKPKTKPKPPVVTTSRPRPSQPSTTKHRTPPHTQITLPPMIVHMASNNTPAPLYHFSPIYKTNSKYQPNDNTLLTTIQSLLRNQLSQLQFHKDKKGIDYTKDNYFEVHHYYNQQNRVSDQIFKGTAPATKCSNKTLSELLCVPDAYAVCLTNGFILCVTHLRNTSSCDFNVAESCVVTRLPCIEEDPACLKYISQNYMLFVPCVGFVRIVSNVVYNDVPTQGSSDFYRNHIDIENNYCVTTVAEPKQLQSGVGSFMRLLGELGKSNWNILKNSKII